MNALVPELKAKGVEAIVVLIHEGGMQEGDYYECSGISGAIVEIVKKLDKAVDVVITGHTHRAYLCVIDGRLVTSADKFGTLVTAIDLKLDRTTHDVVTIHAENHIVRSETIAKDPEQTALIESYEKVAAPIANRRAGTITATLSRVPNLTGESVLGDIVADAQLAATRSDAGAVMSFTNPGGIRTDIAMKDNGAVSYADVFAAQPFRNKLVTLTLSGTQIREMLEQQWRDPTRPRILQVSRGFCYSWDAAKPYGEHVDAASMKLNGAAIEPAKSYRVTVNDYLALGGDGFAVLKDGASKQYGGYDDEALFAFVGANSPISPGPPTRISRVN